MAFPFLFKAMLIIFIECFKCVMYFAKIWKDKVPVHKILPSFSLAEEIRALKRKGQKYCIFAAQRQEGQHKMAIILAF